VKRIAVALFCIAAALPSFAEDRAAKRERIAELLEIIDAKALIQGSFGLVFDRAAEEMARAARDRSDGTENEAAAQNAQQEQLRTFRERLFHRVDYARFAEEIYAPLFDEYYNAAELEELIAFYKTKVGQKSVKMLPHLAIGGMMKGSMLMEAAAREIAQEMEKEEAQKDPWKPTMKDMRTIATATEARATDTNDYPDVDLQGLKQLLEPVYVRRMPEKDGWGTPYLYVGNATQYRIVSAGADKRFEWNARQLDAEHAEARISDDPGADIVFQDGRFMQYPRKAGPELQ
jgi:hypothetical protein